MLDIKPPPPEEFELRVIVWKTEDIPRKTKDGQSKLDVMVKVHFVGYDEDSDTWVSLDDLKSKKVKSSAKAKLR